MRRADWEERLNAFVAKHHARPYSHGWHCLLFVAGAVKAITGEDFAHGHRGKYKSMAGALRYLKALGFDSPGAMIDANLPVKPVGFAGRGDIILGADGIPALCMGEFALSVTDEGLARVPRSEWRKAWRVG
ncbi:MAG: hypothetical protein ACEQR8_04800 [Cypionkella sp.]